MTASFAERFCKQYGIPPERYVEEMLNRSLYPQARWFAWLVNFVYSDYFYVDRELIRDLGLLNRVEAMQRQFDEFHYQPVNRRFLRRQLRLRVSERRAVRIAREVMLPPA